MIPLLIQCANPTCLNPENPLGQRVCDRCDAPLVYRYLWAIGEGADQHPVGTSVGDRYIVMNGKIWLDAKPAQLAEVPPEFPEIALPYLKLFDQRLHVPTVYGFCQRGEGSTGILLLENVPIDASTQLFPSVEALWAKQSSVRQLYWLWQLLELWTALQERGVASSLLIPDHLRVEGWRVRLLELASDDAEDPPSLAKLAKIWRNWLGSSAPEVAEPLREICQQMEDGAELKAIAPQLNQLLLEQSAQLPLKVDVAGATTTGPQRNHNEDACYPTQEKGDALLPYFTLICDGIGGHAGGEVASQLAMRSLQLQMRAMLAEVAAQTELLTPDVVVQQLEAIIRVVNNLISAQNDTQGRESRQRMGTTLVMALQLPQTVSTPNGVSNAHELYLAHVGDSRAYWITPRYCHLLTVDDDVAVREVRTGRNLYREALLRPDAGALTQALGTRDSESLRPTVQRFILEEDGVLLLCSDGLSDHDRVEQSWELIMQMLLKDKISLAAAVESWIQLANERNGHDNTSVVLFRCQVSAESSRMFDPQPIEDLPTASDEGELSESARALLYDDESTTRRIAKPRSKWAIALTTLALIVALSAAGLFTWSRIDPIGFQRVWERVLGVGD